MLGCAQRIVDAGTASIWLWMQGGLSIVGITNGASDDGMDRESGHVLLLLY